MPTLSQSLQYHDLGHLRIIAEHWGVELEAPETRAGLPIIVQNLLDRDLVREIAEALSEDSTNALAVLQDNGGRMLWSQFTRRFGEVREMGPGRRDRERPDRDPISPAEILWYRGFIARAFLDTPRGSEEFVYIPADLLALLPPLQLPSPRRENREEPYPEEKDEGAVLGRPATSTERKCPLPATDRILDHATTLLAALRIHAALPDFDPYPQKFIHSLLDLNGLLDPGGIPDPETARKFLEASRAEALLELAQTWLTSPEHNDLRHVPGLVLEGEWANNPLETRQFILRMLSKIPPRTWWNLSAFIADIRSRHPDFQRPAGDYDSWFVKDATTGQFLRGFEHWDEVDGGLIRYLISGPLHWLGILDLASQEEDGPIKAFRFSGWAAKIFAGSQPGGLPEELSKIHLRSDGRVSVPVLAPRAARYQIARFCEWGDETPHEYRYRLTPPSLARAREQGLRIRHLLTLLNRHTEAVPPNILTALERWGERGTEARLQDVTILRLSSPQILKSLRDSRAARFLGDPVGPTTILIKPGAGEKVMAALAEMGYLGEVTSET